MVVTIVVRRRKRKFVVRDHRVGARGRDAVLPPTSVFNETDLAPFFLFLLASENQFDNLCPFES